MIMDLKAKVFLQVEKLLEEKLSNYGFKTNPHIELCVKILKR